MTVIIKNALICIILVNVSVLDLRAQEIQSAGQLDFVESFTAAESSIRANDLENARKHIDEMNQYRQQYGFPPYEEAHFQLATYWLMTKTNNVSAANQALTALVETGAGLIESDLYVPAGLELLKQQIESMAYQEALLTAEWMQADNQAKTQLRRYRDTLGKVQDVVDGEDAIFAPGATNELGQWQRMLIRPNVYLEDVLGNIRQYVLKCDNKQTPQTIKFNPQGALKIPSSWGKCTLLIEGEPESSFTLVQYQ